MLHFKPEIEYRNPETLLPYGNNAKLHPADQIDLIASQITEFGFDQPIVITKEGVIIKGHGRREASLRLGLKLVPVIVSTLDDQLAAASRLGDNKSAESGWDQELLKIELEALKTYDFDIPKMTGFTIPEVEMISLGWESDPKELDAVEENSEGMNCTIKVKCNPEDEVLVREMLTVTLEASGVLGVEVV